jgi:hypothetical protein
VRFTTTVLGSGGTKTGIEVPEEVVTGLGGGKRPKVAATINGYTWRTSVAPMGGKFMVGVSAEVKQATGVGAGDEIEIDLELDTAPRTVEVPADLARALDADPAARRAFDALNYSNQRRHVEPLAAAKSPETRQRRITKIIDTLKD